MKKRLLNLAILSLGLCTPLMSHAIDINLLNVNMGSTERNQLNNTYGPAYGFRPDEVDPVMEAPAEEVPTLLRIAQAAKTSPLTVWMLRKAGLSYGSILSNYSMSPQSLYHNEPRYGDRYRDPYSPGWGAITDPFFVQSSRTYFYRDILGVPVNTLASIPWRGMDSVRILLTPQPQGAFLPPGIAMKQGLWVPPGQRKKMMGSHNFYEGNFRAYDSNSQKSFPLKKGWKGFPNSQENNAHFRVAPSHQSRENFHEGSYSHDDHRNSKKPGNPSQQHNEKFYSEKQNEKRNSPKLAKGSSQSESRGPSHKGKGKH